MEILVKVSSDTVGVFSMAGVRYVNQDSGFTLFSELGYRRLRFTDVSLEPRDGFTIMPGAGLAQPGNLPQTLDYSGLVFKFGVGVSF